ncbi:MAG TPA: hypothetical protein VGO57_07495 [Verrucomicrobiae bacterium]
MSILNNLSGAVLRKAADLKDKIQSLELELGKLIHADNVVVSVSVTKSKPVKKSGGMSAEGRARIIAAQKARWAKVNANKPKPAAKPVAKKRKMTAAGIAKIRAAQKARWAKVKAAKSTGK